MNKNIGWWILGGIALLAIYRKTATSIGPLTAVPDPTTGAPPATGLLDTPYSILPDGTNVTAEQFNAITSLCQSAALNSFGDQCLGITWDYSTVDPGVKIDRRAAPGGVSINVVPLGPVYSGDPVLMAAPQGM